MRDLTLPDAPPGAAQRILEEQEAAKAARRPARLTAPRISVAPEVVDPVASVQHLPVASGRTSRWYMKVPGLDPAISPKRETIGWVSGFQE